MSSRSSGRLIGAVVTVVSIVLIAAIAFSYFQAPPVLRERNFVGVIHVEGAIVETGDAALISSAINNAISNSSIRAVVLKVDSPGGYADLVEQVYLDLLELKRVKPVVASATSALSGGYYVAVAADYIYALPTSFVGNVGVIGVAPPTLIPSESVLETGALKATGFTRLLFPLNLSHALDNFASAVEQGRGSRTRIGPKEIRRGTIYLGSEAVEAGLIDGIGSLQKAAEHAARLASISSYELVDIVPAEAKASQVSAAANHTGIGWNGLGLDLLNKINPPPAIYYLYLPTQAYPGSDGLIFKPVEASITPTAPILDANSVVVDLSHGNKVSEWEFDVLVSELVKRGMAISFASTWEEVDSVLDEARGLIVAAPTKPYSLNESSRIEEFVNGGGMLMLFFDPTSEYQSVPKLMGPINSLANRFGLSFAKGYLYNEEEFYGLYRNIYIRRFENTSLTKDLRTMVLFTATHVHSLFHQAAWTSSDTYSSTGERTGSFSPIVVIEGEGTIAAFGDITFMTEPFCYLEDNYRLVLNIVSKLAKVGSK